MTRRAESVLPCPGVRFEPGFGRRLEALASRLALARERREGGGVPSLLGGGAEFVGYRPYARGDDLRALDWDLWARSRRPQLCPRDLLRTQLAQELCPTRSRPSCIAPALSPRPEIFFAFAPCNSQATSAG